ncbi:MAG: response regulator [Deltaproteobacteria bacterium]|nr:response regulator [Deltaproteobacteria bacterium]
MKVEVRAHRRRLGHIQVYSDRRRRSRAPRCDRCCRMLRRDKPTNVGGSPAITPRDAKDTRRSRRLPRQGDLIAISAGFTPDGRRLVPRQASLLAAKRARSRSAPDDLGLRGDVTSRKLWEGMATPDFREVFEAAPGLFLVLATDTPRFTIVAASDSYLRATMTTRESILGRGLFEVFPDNPNDPQATGVANLRASLERVIATRAPDTMAVQKYDIPRAGAEGFEERFWSPMNSPVIGADGSLRCIIHRVEDVTALVRATELGEELRGRTREMEREVIQRSQELAEANRELREANEKLGALDVAKTAFLSNVSHELRTPLTLIRGPIEDAVSEADGALRGQELQMVRRSALRLHRLINSILDFSRIEAGRLQSCFEPTDLAVFTAGLAASFQSLFESSGLKLVIDCPPLRAPVYVDRSHWEKIVLNLVSNAFKATFRGEITVRQREAEGRVEIEVSDTGTGIPEHERARIFERFHRVEGARGRSFEGTGIGLSLVQELVKAHGGSVRVDSQVGKGSTFTVTIPTGTAHLPQDRLVEHREPAAVTASDPFVTEASQWLDGDPGAADDTSPAGFAEAAPSERARILVVDDNADMREYLTRLLRRHWTVDAVGDGEAALALVHESRPDLILSDVTMPRMDGFGLLRSLRASAATRGIPVIFLSARAGEEAIVEGLETGADDYLLKPFSARELLTRVRSHLDAAHARTSALRVSETRFRRLAESGIFGITVEDAAGRILEANDAFLAMVGFSREDLFAGRLDWALLAPKNGAGHDRADTQATRPREREYRRRDGSPIPVLAAVAPLEGGESLSVSLDLSERKRLEDQFRQAQKMEAVGRLAGGLAHDFNNVLSIVLSYTDLIVSDLRAEDPLRGDLEEIHAAGLRAAELTRQLLAFSRQQVLDMKLVDLGRIVAGMHKMIARLLGADIEVIVLPAGGLRSVRADVGQIEQVLMNLAVNARDAMPLGGKLVIEIANVELDADYASAHHGVQPGPYVMLAVTDNGVGMDKETQSRVFEPFFTTKAPGKGTGLGLATVFGIVKQSGGHIWLYSEPAKGTTFKLYFPAFSESAGDQSSERPPSETGRGTETILLVEDDDQVRALARNILRRSGYVVLEAPNGGEALLICERHGSAIHLLLTDVVLPRLSGRQLAERLSALRPDMKILFMSGYTDDAIHEHGVLDSGVAYLEKPLTPTSLTRKVREVLGSRSGR